MNRDLGSEIDELKKQLIDLQKRVQQSSGNNGRTRMAMDDPPAEGDEGFIYYSGQYLNKTAKYKWEAQERQIGGLLNLDGEKTAKILAALGNKQRVDILRTVIKGPATGGELVEQLRMGTTGQLYHHIKALMGSDLLIQEERGGEYSLPAHRVLLVLLLLTAAAELADTSTYMEMNEARDQAGLYLGGRNDYDPHLLVWALLENSILEHRAGYCGEVDIFMHSDGCVTVSDNGRGIPVSALTPDDKPNVQAVLTDIQRNLSASYFAAGGEKGISVAVVNALSEKLAVEVRRDGTIYRQDYKRGIPQTGVLRVGSTLESGTSITLEPDRDLFGRAFEGAVLDKRAAEIREAYPHLTIRVHAENLS